MKEHNHGCNNFQKTTFKSILATSCTGAVLLFALNAQAADGQASVDNAALMAKIAKIEMLEAQLEQQLIALKLEIQNGQARINTLNNPSKDIVFAAPGGPLSAPNTTYACKSG